MGSRCSQASVPAERRRVVIVRHGERLDEVDYEAFDSLVAKDPSLFHDPPLTAAGKAQANGAARALQQASFDASTVELFASPSLRTVATASEIGRALGLPDMRIAHGLYSCAAACRRHGLKNLKLRKPGDALYEEARLGFTVTGVLGDAEDSFLASLKRSINATRRDRVCVVVAHREGIRELCDALRVPCMTHYCSAFEFGYSPRASSFDFAGRIFKGYAR
ncbi:hypothetical protein DIPPA_11544 [Diplonema papillatum]|nr:hypothetical protein DIPPA_11544 [Diplonema papillatum]